MIEPSIDQSILNVYIELLSIPNTFEKEYVLGFLCITFSHYSTSMLVFLCLGWLENSHAGRG